MSTNWNRANMDDTAAKREGHSLQHDESVQEVKRVKSDDRGAVEKSSEAPEAENILSAVTATKVLKDSAREKSIFIHGKVRMPSPSPQCVCLILQCRNTVPHLTALCTAGRPGGRGHHGVDAHHGGHAGGALRQVQAPAGERGQSRHHLSPAGSAPSQRYRRWRALGDATVFPADP